MIAILLNNLRTESFGKTGKPLQYLKKKIWQELNFVNWNRNQTFETLKN